MAGAKLSGAPEMLRKLQEGIAAKRQQAANATHAAAETVLVTAKERVPVATGALRESGRVETVVEDNTIKSTIVFDAPYAAKVHEDLDARHDNGQAKFLESALRESRTTIAAEI